MADLSNRRNRIRTILGGAVVAVTILIFAPGWIGKLRATHGAVATFTRVLEAGNTQDLAGLRVLCTRRFLETQQPKSAQEGGIVGLPRNIHKNFQAWCEGPAVLLCPTNRIGPVYRLVEEDGHWKFDGLVGLLRSDGQVSDAAD